MKNKYFSVSVIHENGIFPWAGLAVSNEDGSFDLQLNVSVVRGSKLRMRIIAPQEEEAVKS